MFNPVSTYRIQFHKGFTLSDFEKLIPYFKKLGVGTIYASPLFAATPGSTHGYDSVNANQINPEIGTYEQLKIISRQLKANGISWLQDIVPNHMAYHPENTWLMDVLEKGELSAYQAHFDFVQPLYHLKENPIMVPFLGDDLDNVIEKSELQLAYADNKLKLQYFDSAYPVNIHSYEFLLNRIQEEWAIPLKEKLNKVLTESKDSLAFSIAFDELIANLSDLLKDNAINANVDKAITDINQDKNLLSQIISQQFYRLCHWQETDKQINFRRFFTVNGLICLNIQLSEVFHDYHQLIKKLLDYAVIQGLRIDHIDGLFNPSLYLQQLRQLAGKDTYIVAEKILEKGEDFPEQWEIQGNTGYDFLALVNNLFTRKESEQVFTNFYNSLAAEDKDIKTQIFQKKRSILHENMLGELDNLYKLFLHLGLAADEELSKTNPEDLKLAIAEFLVHFPAYRCYSHEYPLSKEDFTLLEVVFTEMRKEKYLEDNFAINLLEDVLLYTRANEEKEQAAMQFFKRCMQFTGPLMAKGVEDTLMYTYSRFIGHNEVGDSPEAFGLSIADFHDNMLKRQEKWPLSLNATATHDTKRGEDTRARLNVISCIAEEWTALVSNWKQMNQKHKQNNFPDPEDEYFIYQTIAGSYPMPGQEISDYENRLHEYLEKALREAKKHSNWTKPNEEYEQAVKNFVSAILHIESNFYKSFKSFHQNIADAGIINSLNQVLLKFTCPGVPDVYQGCERWDLSFVDPDNRRPVNYDLNADYLDDLLIEPTDFSTLWDERYSGKIKLWLTQSLMQLRRQEPNCFSLGEYIPLEITGEYKNQVIAFERKWKNTSYIIVAPLALPHFKTEEINKIAQLDWKDTALKLPDGVHQYQNQLIKNHKPVLPKSKELPLNELFKQFPFAVLKVSYPENTRNAGVLLPITSLNTPYGIGDIGPSAFKFVDYLSNSQQKYWQVLPLTPTEKVNGYSPYSSFSSMAGNTMLISLDVLAAEGLINNEELSTYCLPHTNKVAYEQAIANKTKLLDRAWLNFVKESNKKEFNTFCEKENSWLQDYALYVLLKEHHQNKPWYQWDKEYKHRDKASLTAVADEKKEELQKIKWLQYVFYKQWNSLKQYCKKSGIQIIGDLPFYVSYDSVDVWVSPEIFALDDNLNPEYIAGVPPDYFNADGQLWGMPIFNWEKLEEQNFKWWIQRIKKNLELYDLLRLDHFRAFAAYWSVDSKESTAINGKWVKAPGQEFFKALEQELGQLPLLAEDLGDIDDDVHQLRNNFKMPGMKVLQFAFGDSLATSEHIPHNFKDTNAFVYTGTHDNNTIKGWYKNDIDEVTRKQLQEYTGIKTDENNVHEILIKQAYASVAKTVIIPMQDILGLDQDCRINIPASAQGNWQWRLTSKDDLDASEIKLKQWVALYNRV